MRIALLLIVLVLLGCAQPAAEYADDSAGAVDVAKWRDNLRVKHPGWYTCRSDQDCVTVKAVCGSSCPGDAMNTVGYSDYVVEFSKVCNNAARTMQQCPRTVRSCNAGVCRIKYLDG